MSQLNFRKFIPTPEQAKVHGETARDHAKKMIERPVIQGIFAEWDKLFEEPFRGITTDGKLIPNLFGLRAENAPSEKAIIAANLLLEKLTKEQINSCCFEINSEQWRNWQNTEIYIENYGLRLCELTIPTREAVIEILKICLSTKGFEKTRNVMRLNGFLGDLLNSSDILGEFTFLFSLFGRPALSEPWGWQLFGHHLSLNCIILKDQITLTPTFMGAEPCFADRGTCKGIGLFNDEEKYGLELMQSLSVEQKKQARVAHSLVGGDLPQGRRSHHDGLHLGGAYCDNRIIPLEGLPGNKFKRRQKQDLIDLIAEYMSTLPKGPFEAKMKDIERYLAETHFCWIGGEKENEPFYYRIQSPVTLIEFDHHAGVFLTNSKPENFHVHTLVRTPNGNDYGMDLIRQHYENSPHHKNHLTAK
ncbi:MAG: DUF3500 domain-containing protein [Pseudomonadota bacterium]|nr:DUF3500 domain-containing protein [Pseudomonadota bacterium]